MLQQKKKDWLWTKYEKRFSAEIVRWTHMPGKQAPINNNVERYGHTPF